MSDIGQKHMKGVVQATIESKLEPKELGFNELLRQGVYQHLDEITIDIYPSKYRLAIADDVGDDSGASLIGVDDSTYITLAGSNVQQILNNLDSGFGSIWIKADGSIAFTGNQSMGGFELTNVGHINMITSKYLYLDDEGYGFLQSNESTLRMYMAGDILLDTSGGNITLQPGTGNPIYLTGDVLIPDDKKLYFGTDLDGSIEYDEDGTDALIIDSYDITMGRDTSGGNLKLLGATTLPSKSALGTGYPTSTGVGGARESAETIEKRYYTVTPTGVGSDDYYAFTPVDGQEILIKNLSGSITALIDQDKTIGISLTPGAVAFAHWDLATTSWIII